MRATLCPEAIILTQAQGASCGLNSASEVCLIFNTNDSAQLMHLKCTIAKD